MKENIQIRNLAALRAIKEATLAVMDPEKSGSPRVVVGLATCGIAAGAQDVYDALKNELKAQGMDYVLLEATGCVGICQFEPVVEVYIPHPVSYTHLDVYKRQPEDSGHGRKPGAGGPAHRR